MVSQDEFLNFIKRLESPLKLYDDPNYSTTEKETIAENEKLVEAFYFDLRKDGFLDLKEIGNNKTENERILKFTKTTINIANKLLTKDFWEPEEQWFILLSLYCWWCEMIKNQLTPIAKKIYKSSKGKDFKKIMMLRKFMEIVCSYGNGKFAKIFSEIDVDLRNSFAHGNIYFPNNEVVYFKKTTELRLPLEEVYFKFRMIPAVYAHLFSYPQKVFVDKLKENGKKKGWL